MPIRGLSFLQPFPEYHKTLAFMTASSRAISPPGTAIRETGNMLATLIEAERVAASQKAEAGFRDLLEHQKREADYVRERFESETATYRQRIQELEIRNAGLQAQLGAELGQSQILNNASAILCQASHGTIDPRNLMTIPPDLKPSSTLSFEQFGVLVEKDTISFQGLWVNLWKELATMESIPDDQYTKAMTPADLERLLNASIENVRRNKEEVNSCAQSIMGAYTQF